MPPGIARIRWTMPPIVASTLYSRLVADLPIALDPSLAGRLLGALDADGKIPRALDALGPVADRDVILLDGTDGDLRSTQLRGLGARVRPASRTEGDGW